MSDSYGGTAGSASNYDDSSAGNSAGSYGNTHSSTPRVNPLHPSDPQSTANPAYGKSHTHSSPYETAGANPPQGGPSSSGAGSLGSNYHEAVDATYGHATGQSATAPSDTTSGAGATGPYETAGANPGQADDSSEMSDNKVKKGGSGIKGAMAALHGAGESIRGQLNAGVDKAFNEVCEPILFPDLHVLVPFSGEEDDVRSSPPRTMQEEEKRFGEGAEKG